MATLFNGVAPARYLFAGLDAQEGLFRGVDVFDTGPRILDGEELLDEAFLTPDPDPVEYVREQPLVNPLYIGSSQSADALNKRTYWTPGVYHQVLGDNAQGFDDHTWRRCVDLTDDVKQNPIFAAPEAVGLENRPAVRFNGSDLRQRGALANVGDLVAITVSMETGGTAGAAGTVLATYTWDGETLNDEGEAVLVGSYLGQPSQIRACPVTRCVFLDPPFEPPPFEDLGAVRWPDGTEPWVTYTVVPPLDDNDVVDATPELQRIVDAGKNPVVPRVPNAWAYLTTDLMHEEDPDSWGENLQIGAGQYVRGEDPVVGVAPNGRKLYARMNGLRTWPGRFGIALSCRDRPQTNSIPGTPQAGAGLYRTTFRGSLDSIRLQDIVGLPSGNHHGFEVVATNDLDVEGVRFTRCYDDGLKTASHLTKSKVRGEEVLVDADGLGFTLQQAPTREGQNKLKPPSQGVLLQVYLNDGSGDSLYCTNATEKNDGLCFIGRVSSPIADEDDDANIIGLYDTSDGRGELFPGNAIPTAGVTADYEHVEAVSCARLHVRHCEFDLNGRNGVTIANAVGTEAEPPRVHHIIVKGNSKVGIGGAIPGSFATEAQICTTERSADEVWKFIVAQFIEVYGSMDGAFKVGQEKGYRYILGPGYWSDIRLVGGRATGLKMSGARLGGVVMERWHLEGFKEGFSVDNGGSVRLFDLTFENNREVDLAVSKRAVDFEATRIEAIGARGLVRSAGFGETFYSPRNFHFEARSSGGEYEGPPIEIYDPQGCTFDLPAGSIIDGVPV